MALRVSASVPLDVATTVSTPRAPARVALSFEIIPPRDAADTRRVDEVVDTLAAYSPDYIAVTSSRRSGWLDGTADLVNRVSSRTAIRPLAHLACTAGTAPEMAGWIDRLVDAGVRGLLALRGDLPEGGLPPGHLPHATDLIRLIREREARQEARFAAGRLAIGVACYPNGHAESANFDEDIDVLLAKQRLGAHFAITQLFFDAEDYHRFVARARLAGVRIPLIPGIMPVTSPAKLERMSQLSGLPVPDRLRQRLSEDPDSGLDITAELARSCLDLGAGALHIYTHNNLELTRQLLERIGL